MRGKILGGYKELEGFLKLLGQLMKVLLKGMEEVRMGTVMKVINTVKERFRS